MSPLRFSGAPTGRTCPRRACRPTIPRRRGGRGTACSIRHAQSGRWGARCRRGRRRSIGFWQPSSRPQRPISLVLTPFIPPPFVNSHPLPPSPSGSPAHPPPAECGERGDQQLALVPGPRSPISFPLSTSVERGTGGEDDEGAGGGGRGGGRGGRT